MPQQNGYYPKSNPIFKFPWKIAEFVVEGKRLSLENFDESIAKIISQCWVENPLDRMNTSEIIESLEKLL